MDSSQSVEYAKQFGDKFYRSRHRIAICAACGTIKKLIMKSKRKRKGGEAYWRTYYPVDLINKRLCEQHDWRNYDG